MDSLLTKLYYGQIDIANKKIQPQEITQDKELYQEVYQTLSPAGQHVPNPDRRQFHFSGDVPRMESAGPVPRERLSGYP